VNEEIKMYVLFNFESVTTKVIERSIYNGHPVLVGTRKRLANNKDPKNTVISKPTI